MVDLPRVEDDLHRALVQIGKLQRRADAQDALIAELQTTTQRAAAGISTQIDNFIRNGDIAHSFDTYYHAAPVANDTRFEAWDIYRNPAPVAGQQLKEDSVYSGVAVANSLALPDPGRSDTPNVDPDWNRQTGYARLGSTSTLDFPLPSNVAFPGRFLFCILILARKSANVVIPGRLYTGVWDNTAGQRNWLPAAAFAVTGTVIGTPAATVSREYFVVGRTDFGRTIGSTLLTVPNAPSDSSFVSNSVYVQLAWQSIAGVIQWDIYRKTSGVYHYLGQTNTTGYFDQGRIEQVIGAYPDVSTTNEIAYSATRPGDLDNVPIDMIAPAWKFIVLALKVPTTYNMGLTTDKQWLRIGFDQALTGSDAVKGCYIDLVGLSYSNGLWAHNPADLLGLQQPISGPNGSGQGGGGTGGGSGGGGGACFSGNVTVQTPDGLVSFESMRAASDDGSLRIINRTGTHRAELLVHEDYVGTMIDMGYGELVTLDHLMRHEDNWHPAVNKYPENRRVEYCGTVFNLHILSEDPADQHYVLGNGEVAHNIKREPL